MTSEIKFRVWYKNQMYLGYEIDDLIFSDGHYLESSKPQEQREIMQYVGLKDKYGREIYEGDIVRTFNLDDEPILSNVVRMQDIFCLEPRDDITDEEEFQPLGEYVEGPGVEIVGNIYEDPEVVDVAK